MPIVYDDRMRRRTRPHTLPLALWERGETLPLSLWERGRGEGSRHARLFVNPSPLVWPYGPY